MSAALETQDALAHALSNLFGVVRTAYVAEAKHLGHPSRAERIHRSSLLVRGAIAAAQRGELEVALATTDFALQGLTAVGQVAGTAEVVVAAFRVRAQLRRNQRRELGCSCLPT